MANTYSTDLILDKISSRVETVLGNRFAPLNAFAKDFSTDAMQQGQNVRFGQATAGATAQKNRTSWESGDSTMGNINVPVDHYGVSFHITPRERNNGLKLQDLIDVNMNSFADKIIDVALTPMTTSNFSNITIAQASIVAANLQTAWAGIAKSQQKSIVLDSTAYSKLLPTDKNGFGLTAGAYGFDGFYLNTRWTGAGTNIYGFAAGPQAVAMVAGLPEYDPELIEDLNLKVMTIPQIGLSFYAGTWVSRSSRQLWASFDVAFGAARNDNSACYLFKSA